jgi:hypothetical protein
MQGFDKEVILMQTIVHNNIITSIVPKEGYSLRGKFNLGHGGTLLVPFLKIILKNSF